MDKRKGFKDIGELDARISIQLYSSTRAGDGGVKAVSWTSIATPWALVTDKPGKLNIVLAGKPTRTDSKLFICRFKRSIYERNHSNMSVVCPTSGYRTRYYVRTLAMVLNKPDYMAIECHTNNAENIDQ